MKWELSIIAAAVLAVSGVSRRLTGGSITPAMAFTFIGVLVGPLVADGVTVASTNSIVRTLAETTLAIVLFADASRIRLRALSREYAVPLRLLAVGLPLTIALGAGLAAGIFDQLAGAEAVVLAVALAPTDAALGQAVVTESRLPSRIRQGLNVESGLNDGICVPLLLIALAAAEVEDKVATSHHAVRIVFEEIGYGVVGGLAAGVVAAAVVAIAWRRRLITGSWLPVVPLAAAGLAHGLASALGGSGFIAAFLAGAIFGALVHRESERASRLNEELGELLGGVTFLIFGAVLWAQRSNASVGRSRSTQFQPHPGTHAPRRDRDDPHRRNVADRRVSRLAWAPRSGIDRVRSDRRSRSAPATRRHNPVCRVRHDRPVSGCARSHSSATSETLCRLVRVPPERSATRDGERPRSRTSTSRNS